ncbi:MAG: sensor histidine kinase [Gaiellales bacterium]
MSPLTRVLDRSRGGREESERLARRVEDMAERLAREEHKRASVIGRVSHELRTPLTVIKGYVYTLQRGESDPDKLRKLDIIAGECEHLAYQVEQLLELSRSRAGEMRVSWETFELRPCVEEVVERLQTIPAQRGVELEFVWNAGRELVRGDQNRLRQIFANLITNGSRYAPPGSTLTVCAEREDGEIAVSVEDRGRGIAESDLPYIFDEFFQAGARSEPGAGLGLAIARELAEAHGGAIDVRSTVGAGTCFTVRLPVWEGA